MAVDTAPKMLYNAVEDFTVLVACTEVILACIAIEPIELELLGEFLGSGCRSGCTTVIPLN